MFTAIKAFLKSLKPLSQTEREHRYLAGSVDLVDLEHRQRQIDEGLFRSNFPRYY